MESFGLSDVDNVEDKEDVDDESSDFVATMVIVVIVM